MEIIPVALADNAYPIYLGENLLSQKHLFEPHIQGTQVCIVSNETVAPLYLSTLKKTLRDRNVIEVILPDGEAYKSMASAEHIFDRLIDNRFHRTCTLIALGGGVIGDVTGFAAACYQRGVDFIQVPTTLLAQVDASVGGKTAVNHPRGKNMIGAFHHPQCVIMDLNTLETLPTREYRAGFAEIVKHALIADSSYFDDLVNSVDALMNKSPQCLHTVICRSCQIKAKIVSGDPKEQGERILLNFGHTFAHAIETCSGYGTYLHGEAVSIGIAMAADLSQRLGLLQPAAKRRILDLLQHVELPIAPPPELTLLQLKSAMALDKKMLEGGLQFILLQQIGHGIVKKAVLEDMLDETLIATGCKLS